MQNSIQSQCYATLALGLCSSVPFMGLQDVSLTDDDAAGNTVCQPDAGIPPVGVWAQVPSPAPVPLQQISLCASVFPSHHGNARTPLGFMVMAG